MEEYYTLSKPYDPQKLTPYSIRMLELYENGKPIGKKITVRADGAYSPEVEIVSKEADRALRDKEIVREALEFMKEGKVPKDLVRRIEEKGFTVRWGGGA